MRRRSGRRARCTVRLPPSLGECTLHLPSTTLHYLLLLSNPIYHPLLPHTTLYSYPLVVGNKILCKISPNDPIDIIIYYDAVVLTYAAFACTWEEPCGRHRGASSDEKFLVEVRPRHPSDCPAGEVAALPEIVCQLPSPAWLICYIVLESASK